MEAKGEKVVSYTQPKSAIRLGTRGIPCPRTYIPQAETRQEDLENRFGYLRSFITEFKVNGAIFYIIRYCDTYELDAPDVRDYLKEQGIPVLVLEDEYNLATIGQLRTRIQAFLEMIRGIG